MSASRHIHWCKQQAHARIATGDLQGAFDSFVANMGRGLDPQISPKPKVAQIAGGKAAVAANDVMALASWVDSFEEPAVLLATG